MIPCIGLIPILTRRSRSPMCVWHTVILFLILLFLFSDPAQVKAQTVLLNWTELSLPVENKRLSQCRFSVFGGQLLCFSERQNEISILADPKASWQKATLAPSSHWNSLFDRLDHGASLITTDHGLICCGGTSVDVFRLNSKHGVLEITQLQPLPRPINSCMGAVLDDVLYVIGNTTWQSKAKYSGWLYPLSDSGHQKHKWKQWDIPVEVLQSPSVLIEQDGALYLIQGQSSDLYRFHPQQGWQMVEHAPVSDQQYSAVPIGSSHLLVSNSLGPQNDFLYHTITDTWRTSPFLFEENGNMVLGTVHELIAWENGILSVRNHSLFWGKLQRVSAGLQTVDLMVLGAYLSLLIVMSLYFACRERNCNEYFLAGQRIPWWAAGLSLLGSSVSAITFMAFPAMSYRTDWVYLLGNFMILAVAPLVIWFYLPFYRRLKVTTAYEYLEYRFGLMTRLVGSATFLLFQLGRMGVVIYLPALALSAVSSWNIYTCILVIGSFATLYTTLGGIEAVIWTDVLQVIVLIGGAIISLSVILTKIPGGLEAAVTSSVAAEKLRAINYSWDVASAGIGVVIVGNLFKFLIPYSCDQGVIQRYLITSDERQAARGIWLNAVASIPVWTLFFALGTGLWVFYRAYPENLDPVGRTDEIFAWFIVHELPGGIAGLVVAGLFAASMSSLDTSLNSMATVITTDFYQHFFPHSTDRTSLRLARLATVILGVFGTLTAVYLAWCNTQSIWEQFLKIMGLFGGGLAGMFVAGILTRSTTQVGILVGFIVSGLTLFWAQSSGSVHFFLYGAIGILTCSLVGWSMSQILPGTNTNLDGLTIHSLNRQRFPEE